MKEGENVEEAKRSLLIVCILIVKIIEDMI